MATSNLASSNYGLKMLGNPGIVSKVIEFIRTTVDDEVFVVSSRVDMLIAETTSLHYFRVGSTFRVVDNKNLRILKNGVFGS